MSHLLRLPLNKLGNDYVVGDIHGYFSVLEKLLKAVNFNAKKDRLISVGDLIDRGPHSERALEFLNQPWFYAVRGNHEELLMDAVAGEGGKLQLWSDVGGEWSHNAPSDLLRAMSKAFSKLPLLIEVETPKGKIGVVHADVPDIKDWDKLTHMLEKKRHQKELEATLNWSRENARRMAYDAKHPGIVDKPLLKGVRRIFVGHTVVDKVKQFGNVNFIETGIFCGGMLTLVNLHTEQVYSSAE